jgi:hypothetical protein
MDNEAEEFGNIIAQYIANNKHVPRNVYLEILYEATILLKQYLRSSFGFRRREDFDILYSSARNMVSFKQMVNELNAADDGAESTEEKKTHPSIGIYGINNLINYITSSVGDINA